MAKKKKEIPQWLTRSRRKARLNEIIFRDSNGNEVQNNWHHVEWFDHAERHDRLMIEAAREHAKTQLFVFTQPLLEIKNNPNIRILIVSDVYEKAKERTRVLREHIERNPKYNDLPGHVKIGWKRGDEAFTVERDFYWLKEATVTSTYAYGPISGGRFDLIIADDLVNWAANSTTPEKRQKLRRWWSDEVLNATTPDGRIWVIGTRQHHDDLYETIKRDARFTTYTYPAVDERWKDRNPPEIEGNDRICLWPAMHNYKTLMEKKEADEDSFARQQQQIAIPETGLVYRRALVDAAFERGRDVQYDPSAAQYVALDPGYGQRAAMLAIQETAGDKVEVYAEHSFTHLDDNAIVDVVVDHCAEVQCEYVFIDAADPGLASALVRELKAEGLPTRVQPVPFQKYKRLSIKAVRWLLGTGRISFGLQSTTVHKPGRVLPNQECIFRNEIRDYAMKEGEDDEPMKGDDHGPDALSAYAAKWITPWLKATGQEGQDTVTDIRIARKNREDRQARAQRRASGLWIRSV